MLKEVFQCLPACRFDAFACCLYQIVQVTSAQRPVFEILDELGDGTGFNVGVFFWSRLRVALFCQGILPIRL